MARESGVVNLEISARWRPARVYQKYKGSRIDLDTALDEVSTCTLLLSLDNHLMTRMVDANQEVRDGPLVSAFRLAEWFLWNWWRIRWEPAYSGGTSVSWRQAHETASIGGGWLWPRFRFESDGRAITIRSSGSEATPTEPISYLADDVEHFVLATQFEQAIDAFVDQVISHLGENRLANPIRGMRHELRNERDDAKAATYRRLEALVGRNPDEVEDGVIDRLMKDRASLGVQAADEVAAVVPLTKDGAITAHRLRSEARQVGFDVSDRDGPAPIADSTVTLMASDHAVPLVPWQVGASAAKALREGERLGDGPISDRMLGEMCGLPRGALRKSGEEKPAMAYTLSSKGGRRMVFRARVPTGRRFDAARLLGDKLLVRNGESLQPATRTHTFRQKMQRAFAAELLCPLDALVDSLGGDYSDESIEEAANVFKVSPMVVATRLENNGMLDSRSTRYAPA